MLVRQAHREFLRSPLAAHLPTDRTMEQAFENAYRLHRGEKLHEE